MSNDLHIVCGDRGSGKSSLLVAKLDEARQMRGDYMLHLSKSLINAANEGRKKELNYPNRVPIYTCNLDVKIPLPGGGSYTPYKIAGYNIGSSGVFKVTEDNKTEEVCEEYEDMFFASALFVDEAQTVFPSRTPLRPGQLKFFTECRHAYYDVWLAGPRGISIHKDIRGVCGHFMHVLGFNEHFTPYGKRVATTWCYREFTSFYAFEEYINANNNPSVGGFTEDEYTYNGDVTTLYDGHARIVDFTPKEGKQFVT